MPSLNSVTFWVMTLAAGAGASAVISAVISGSSTVKSCGSSVSAEDSGSGDASVHPAVYSVAVSEVPAVCGGEDSARRGARLSETRIPAAMNAICRAAPHIIPGNSPGAVPAAEAAVKHSASTAAALSNFFLSIIVYSSGHNNLIYLYSWFVRDIPGVFRQELIR